MIALNRVSEITTYLKWLIFSIIKVVLLIFTAIPAALIIPLFTKVQPSNLPSYKWGWIWGTFDNPPQGDRGWVSKRSLFKNSTSGVKGYINRVGWMLRNPLYGLSRKLQVSFVEGDVLDIKGNPNISDKNKVSGWMFAKLKDSRGNLKAFEWYSVTPYSKRRNVRIRIGWKIKTDKMQERGWARHVITINPFDGYGND